MLYHTDSRALNGVKKDSSAHASKKMNPEEQKDGAADNSGAKIQASGKNSKEKSSKKKDDDNGLKKPLSAYMLFNNFRRPVLRDEYPRKFLFGYWFQMSNFFLFVELKLTEISKLIGEEWAKLSNS